ncbi:hypothetical protein K2P97_12835 [bacterium]|nr:hypothetical protein [bacterium]
MKKISLLILVLLFSSWSFAAEVLTGVYKLNGTNPNSSDGKYTGSKYEGSVVIEKTRDKYYLYWFIGSKQSQHGVAVLKGDVLEVEYFDDSGADKGVVLFKVSGKNINGKWKSDYSKNENWGLEDLTFVSSNVQAEKLMPDRSVNIGH